MLIVVVIMGILAATVLPQFASSTAKAKESALRTDLAQLRSQIQLYRFQHDGSFPAGAATNVVNQLTLASAIDGTTAVVGTAGFPFGPYRWRSPFTRAKSGNLLTSSEPRRTRLEIAHSRNRVHFGKRRSGQRVMARGPAPERPKGRLPRITRLMALAIRCERLIQNGEIADYAQLAGRGMRPELA